jgi:amidophosphoribosyltransferase
VEEIRKMIGADSLGYMPIGELQNMVGKDLPICKACFNSDYPMEVPTHEIRDLLEGC